MQLVMPATIDLPALNFQLSPNQLAIPTPSTDQATTSTNQALSKGTTQDLPAPESGPNQDNSCSEIRRKLFHSPDSNADLCEDISELSVSDDRPVDDTGSASQDTISKQDNGGAVKNISKAAAPTSPSPNSSMCESVPEEILRLSNLELRQKLVSLGEKPGLVNKTTREAYQKYLARIEAKVQPAGNKGYKSTY